MIWVLIAMILAAVLVGPDLAALVLIIGFLVAAAIG
jgi:hypothetical protein